MSKKKTFWQRRAERRSLKIATAKKKLDRGICLTPHCRRFARKQARYCNTCRSRKYDHPVKVLFWNLRKSARRRGKSFTLTWEWFREQAVASGYDLLHGQHKDSLTVDRIDPRRGYEPDNIQFITRSENSAKRWTEETGDPF